MQAWEEFLIQQEAELGKETVNKWLRSIRVLSFDACNLYLEAKDSFQANWFEEQIRKKVNSRLLNNNKRRIKVHMSVADGPAKLPKGKSNKKAPPVENPPEFTLLFDGLDPQCTFDTFVVSEANELAHRMLKTSTDNPVYLFGGCGTGKTHLLMAAAHALRAQGLNVVYARAETFTEHVVSAIRSGQMSLFRQTYRNSDVLILDDVHVFSRKGATQEELFHTFNTLHVEGRQIILSANCSPAELQHIEPRLVSRFEWGIVIPVEPLSKEKTLEMLQIKTRTMGYELHPKVMQFLVETFSSSTKALCKALDALILRSHLDAGKITAQQVTVAIAKHQLADLIADEHKKALTPEAIIQTVAEYFGVTPEDLESKGQTRDSVQTRQIAMYLCRTKLNIPFMKIGDLFNKNHSTVMSSIKVIQNALESNDQDMTFTIAAITKKLS